MNPNLDGDELQAKLDECAEQVEFTTKDGQKCVTFGKFMESIASLRLRGTSKLCRSTCPVFLQLTRAYIRRKKPTSDDLKEWKDLRSVLIPRGYKGVCRRCKAPKYKLATHSVTFDSSGYPYKPIRTNTTAPTDLQSVEFIWSSKSISNVLLDLIRQFAKYKGTVKSPRGLLDGPKERQKMYDLLVKLVEEAKPILKKESRLPNVRYF